MFRTKLYNQITIAVLVLTGIVIAYMHYDNPRGWTVRERKLFDINCKDMAKSVAEHPNALTPRPLDCGCVWNAAKKMTFYEWLHEDNNVGTIVMAGCSEGNSQETIDRKGREPSPLNGTFRAAGLEWAEKAAPTTMDWAGAKSYCATMYTMASGSWRLPTKDELMELYRVKESTPAAHDKQLYWSSTPSTDGDPWGVLFSNGFTNSAGVGTTYYVRCVR